MFHCKLNCKVREYTFKGSNSVIITFMLIMGNMHTEFMSFNKYTTLVPVDFVDKSKQLTSKLLSQGYLRAKLDGRHHDLVDPYFVTVSKLISI